MNLSLYLHFNANWFFSLKQNFMVFSPFFPQLCFPAFLSSVPLPLLWLHRFSLAPSVSLPYPVCSVGSGISVWFYHWTFLPCYNVNPPWSSATRNHLKRCHFYSSCGFWPGREVPSPVGSFHWKDGNSTNAWNLIDGHVLIPVGIYSVRMLIMCEND